MTLLQDGTLGVGALYMNDVIAAGVRGRSATPARTACACLSRERRRRGDAAARQRLRVVLGFTLVGDRLVGTMPGGDPVVITLTRLPPQTASR